MFFPQSFLHSLGKVLFRLIFGKYFSGWWFQITFIFTPILGKMSNLTNIFQRG